VSLLKEIPMADQAEASTEDKRMLLGNENQ